MFDCGTCNFFLLNFQTLLSMLFVISIKFRTKWEFRYVLEKVLSQHILAIWQPIYHALKRESKFLMIFITFIPRKKVRPCTQVTYSTYPRSYSIGPSIAFCRQDIPESSFAKKETVDMGILPTSRMVAEKSCNLLE